MNTRRQRTASQSSRAARFAVLVSTLVLLSFGWPGCASSSSDPGSLPSSTTEAVTDPAPSAVPTATPAPPSTTVSESMTAADPPKPTPIPAMAAQAQVNPTLTPLPSNLTTVTPTPTRTPPTPITALPPSPTPASPTPIPSPPTHNVVIAASVTNTSPAQQTEVTVVANFIDNGKPVAGAPMTASWYYKTVTRTCTGTTNGVGVASCTRYIAGATIGYKVQINIEIAWHGRTYTASTSFTPK